MAYFVYMLLCEDGSYYLGSTVDIDQRFAMHLSGKGASYTRSHKPVKVVYREVQANKSAALKREIELKKLTHAQKTKLVSMYK
jgi:putative endonuclease